MEPIWIVVVVGGAVTVYAIWQFNRLVAMRQLAKNAWSDVDVFLKRRSELIPNLVETVKGYGKYEQSALEKITAARTEAIGERGPTPVRAHAEGILALGIAQVFAYAEAYPDLKANQSYLNLQKELSETETKIASARQYYNACVRDWNTMLEAFPSALFAGIAGMKPLQFFEVDAPGERDAPSAALK